MHSDQRLDRIVSDGHCVREGSSQFRPNPPQHDCARVSQGIMHRDDGLDEFAPDVSGHEQNVGRARREDESDRRLDAEILDRVVLAVTRDRIHADGSAARDSSQNRCQAQRSARSFHAYRTPRSRIVMNISISTRAMTPSRRKTTAHGYMKTISMSKARKSSAIA